jgi:hypothetical protein
VAGVLPLADPIGLAEGLREEVSEEDMGFGSYFLGRCVYQRNHDATITSYHGGQSKEMQTQQSVLGTFFDASASKV